VALLIVVLPEIKLRQQLIYFPEHVNQDELTRIANKLNATCGQLTSAEIARKKLKLTPPETQVLNAIINIMSESDRHQPGRPYFEGMRLMLNQPEFLPTERMLSAMDLIENMDWLGSIVSRQPKEGNVEVVIGEESQQDALRDLSMVFSGYGVPDAIGGTIGVLGPTRMDYGRSIAAVRYLARLLSNLFAGLYQRQ
jgi:heat-inducible transcriptional repressor